MDQDAPLTILRTQIEAMQDGIADPSPRSLGSLHEETLRLSRLVADLEALASADAAHFTLQRRTTRLLPLLEEAAREFDGPFEEKGVTLRTDLDEVEVEADPTRVGQIVTNLLSNALKFTSAEGVVTVVLRGESGGAVLEVSDSGPGIPPDEVPHVFDRFFRGREAKAGGSGIGLTVAFELAKAHGGSLDVGSAPGHGTTFTLRLPASGSRQDFTGPSHPPISLAEARRDRS